MKRIITSCVCLFSILSAIQAQTKWYVTPGAPVSGTGDSWANARDLQTAISNAAAGDSVFVSQGTYQLPNGQFFIMKEGVKIYGRFAGTETSLNERNLYVTYASTLSGSGTSVISNNGNGLTAAALLDGFTISGGTSNIGGGIHNEASSPTISNCIFTGNSGGGIYNTACSATIVNCIFAGNNTSGTIASSPLSYAGGGGITNYNANGVTIANCVFL